MRTSRGEKEGRGEEAGEERVRGLVTGESSVYYIGILAMQSEASLDCSGML